MSADSVHQQTSASQPLSKRLRALAMTITLFCLPWAAATAIADQPVNPSDQYLKYFKEQALPLEKEAHLEPLFKAIAERQFVLLGESTHGTSEYYLWRAAISRHLIEQQNFAYVALEGDWQAIYRLNDFVKGRAHEQLDAATLMQNELTRWPQWMWANEEFAEFIEWLREHNSELPEAQMVGIFGLDMQDPEDSMTAVLDWFAANDEDNHGRVQDIYQQIRNFPENFRGYAQSLVRGGERLDGAIAIPVDLLANRLKEKPDKALWSAWQNALAVQSAEAQFHGATTRGPESWNARARHMHETLLRLAEHHSAPSRGIVWAHNTHVGDSSATDMRQRGEVNIGELLRGSEDPDNVFIVGFGTNKGEVIAGPAWGEQQQKMNVVPAQAGSFEGLLHRSELEQALLLFDEQGRTSALTHPLPQRAIGVVYRPPHEAYVATQLTLRYDAFIYFDTTSALSPLSD